MASIPLDSGNCPLDVSNPLYCQVKMDSLERLKDGTKKLLCLLEDLQTKTINICEEEFKEDEIKDPTVINVVKCLPEKGVSGVVSNTDILENIAMHHLQMQYNKMKGEIFVQDVDNCSVFKRLTRKCNCLNNQSYNDFTIHFNEDTKHITSTQGEIIKNTRIVKKFLYMGGRYTKNALTFLNEGLSECEYDEKLEIIQACSHADICNIFEDRSIITAFIMIPIKSEFGDTAAQVMTANFLFKLAQIEEGRRYLNFSSKITNDLKLIIRRHSNKLDYDTIEVMNSTLNLLNPALTRQLNVTYYCKAEEGLPVRTMNALARYRCHMTSEEIFTHLELFKNLSTQEMGKDELREHFPELLNLFRTLIIENDNPDMNVIIIKTLTGIISKCSTNENECFVPHLVATDMSTEPIRTKDKFMQIPTRKLCTTKKFKQCKANIIMGNEPAKRRVKALRQGSNFKKKTSGEEKNSCEDMLTLRNRTYITVFKE